MNNLLQGLFPGRNIVVYETGVMALELFLYFPLEPWERTILKNYGLIAKGAGVELNWVEIPYPVLRGRIRQSVHHRAGTEAPVRRYVHDSCYSCCHS